MRASLFGTRIGFHLLLDPLACNHLEAVRRAVHLCGFGGAAVLAGIDAGVEQLTRLDRARAGPLQIDFRVDPQRHALFFSRVAIFEAPPLAVARRDLEIQAIVVEDPDGFRSRLGVSRNAVGERHLGATPVRVWPVAPKLPQVARKSMASSGALRNSKSIKNPRFSGRCGRQRMLSDVIGSSQMVEPGGIEP
jgi:hypothetical protein